MNAPTSATRFIGTTRNANALYLLSGLAVFGWFGGAVPWWLGIMALCFIGTVRKAVQDVRRYDAWAADWQAMGRPGSSPRPVAKPSFHMRYLKTPPWLCVTIAALSLMMIPVVMAAPGTDASLSKLLTGLWLWSALYLVWKLAARLRCALFKPAGAKSAVNRKNDAAADVVEWALPRASSSPSRADAVRRLPEYAARVMTAQ